MNIHYLMQHASRQLHTIVQRFSIQGTLLEKVCERVDFQDCLEPAPEEFLRTATDTYPVFMTDSHSISYAAAVANEELFVIGPVRLYEGTVYKYTLHHQENVSDVWMESLHHCTPFTLLNEILLVHNLLHEQALSLSEAFYYNCIDQRDIYEIQKTFTNIVFQNQETLFRHNPYDQEIREFSSIENGDIEQLTKSLEEDYIGHIGILAKDPLRHCKNLGIVLVTLAARAAIRGGVLPDLAFSLSDSYINKIEEVKNPEAAISLGREAEYQYTTLVKEIRQHHTSGKSGHAVNSRISRCKDYIGSHLHGKLSTSAIAKELYLNPSYLSDLFKKEEGITISEYILLEKVKLVKNMLIYSRYSFSEIASYMGFTSQSYLGKKFKLVTGMTLHQYRETYGVKDFYGPKDCSESRA